MENASKALIIAGAILLAILLISLGIMIFNQAQDTVNNSGMSQAEITAFNNKFLKYEGKGKTGSEVKALLSEVIANNGDENNSHRMISAVFQPAGTVNKTTIIASNNSGQPNTKSIVTSKNYNVYMHYYNNGTKLNGGRESTTVTDGCIYFIEINELK